MAESNHLPAQNSFTLAFEDKALEKEFLESYDRSVRVPLRYGIIISVLSWYSAIGLIYYIIPEKIAWLVPLTLLFIGSYFGFIIYATFKKRFEGYYHLMGAISNAWAGLFAIYFCDQFPNGANLTLPVLIFIIFFGSYMVRLRWMAGCVAALSYVIGYHVYIAMYSDLSAAEVMLYGFVAWMTLVFAVLAGRVAESNNRIAFIQRKTIKRQSEIIEGEKEVLLKEVHHRVKNNLQIIVSLVKLQTTKYNDDGIEKALKEVYSRVLSMSLVHQRINQTSNFNSIDLNGYVTQLIEHSMEQFGRSEAKYELEIPEGACVDIEMAIPLGLIINEMVANYFLHCDASRSFKLTLEEDGQGNRKLIYADNGDGFPENTSLEQDGVLGLELIDTLVGQFDGSFSFYNRNGAVCEVKMG